MSEQYERMAATALALLTSKGTDCSLERRAPSAMTASGDRVDGTPTSPAKGVELPGEGTVEVEGVKKPYATVLLSAVEPAPQPDNIVNINGHRRIVLIARNWAPDGTLIYSDLKVGV